MSLITEAITFSKYHKEESNICTKALFRCLSNECNKSSNENIRLLS